MRAKKWLSIITLICSFFSAILAVVFIKMPSNILYDFAMAIFGSSLLGFIMSIIEYNVERRSAMEYFWKQAGIVLSKLRKIKYFNADVPIDKMLDCLVEEDHNVFAKKLVSSTGVALLEEKHSAKENLISWFRANRLVPFSEDDDMDANNYYESSVVKFRQDIQAVIDSCIAVADIDLGELDNAYGNLDFFVNRNIRNKLAYSKVYDSIRKYRNMVLNEQYHFQLLSEGKGNFAICVEKAIDICKEVFEVKISSTGIHNSKLVYQTVFDDIDDALENFRCKIYYKKKKEEYRHNPVFGMQICVDDTNKADENQ